MKVKAAVLWEQGRPRPYAESRPMTIEEIDLDPPGPGEILIEVGGAGLCHSDLSSIEGLRARKLPTVPGHEGAGTIRAVGEGVRGLAVGDHVVTAFVASCGECRYCNGGRPNICTGSAASRADGTLLSGARRMRLGGVGMNALLGAVVAGAERIIAVDTNPNKLALARELGATDTFLAGNADVVQAIIDATNGGVEYAIETAGVAEAMNLAYAITARGGTTVSAGLPAPNKLVSYPHAAMVSDEKTIKGSYMGSCMPQRDIPAYLALYKRGKLPVNRLLSGTIGLEDINAGFDRLAAGSVLRQVLVPNG